MSAKLPENWLNIELGDAVDIYDSERKPINSSERTQRISGKDESELYPYYGATGQVGWIDEYLSNKESVLLGEDGAPFLDPYKDKAYLVKGEFWVNNHAHILRGPEGKVDNRYVCYQLNVLDYSDFVSGTTRLKLTKSSLLKLPLILCSYNEQIRIVEKIEELLSDLDNGVAELKAAQTKLTQYRQSLLKSAVEGTLTQQWRETHKPKETGAQLLERILLERRKCWEESKLAEFKEKGKKPPKDWQKKYPEPVEPETSELPELPEGWIWASLDMLGDIVSGVTKGNKRKAEVITREVPYLRVANVQRSYLDLSIIKTIEATEDEIRKFSLESGDILFNEGGDRDKLGRGWVWYGQINECIHQNHVFRMRPYLKELIPELISHHGNTFGQLWFQTAGKQTTNLASINMGILKRFPVPLAPVDEQVVLFDQLNLEISNIDAQAKNVEGSIRQTEAQRKNILKSAFSGELVEQDSNDEPASVLLERIKSEREERAKQAKPKRVKKKTSTMPKINSDSVKDWISSHSKDKFSFEEIRSAVGGDYETLKDVIFSILSESNAPIEQVFDKPKIGIQFKKVSR